MWHPFRWLKRLRRALKFMLEIDEGKDERMMRAFRGVCPHCGQDLVRKRHSGRVFAEYMRACPDNHFAVEYHSPGIVTYHDREGDPIDYLFKRDFRLLKAEDNVTTRKIPREDEQDEEEVHEEDLEL